MNAVRVKTNQKFKQIKHPENLTNRIKKIARKTCKTKKIMNKACNKSKTKLNL